jgi:hypothetical protein
MESAEFSEYFSKEMNLLEALEKWKEIPPVPATYIFSANPKFVHGNIITDIIYIGKTKHLGAEPNNNRLWDYQSGATNHEKEKISFVKKLENEGTNVTLKWCTKFPENMNERDFEKELILQFEKEHGVKPILNKVR